MQIFDRLHLDSRIFIAGHAGLVGSAIHRRLFALGYKNIIVRSRSELDLLNQAETEAFFQENKIDYVFLAAAKVGGIVYNSRFPADFLYENLIIAANVIHSSAQYGVKKLLYLGSSCIYPKFAQQPIKETELLSGPLEPTNEGYAIAKIAGLKLCEKYSQQYGKCFISCMPTNMYGPHDNYHPEYSHVVPGMMRRFHEAKINNLPEVVVWGSGNPRREFLYSDDFADAALVLMEKYEGLETINVGTGTDCTIRELSEMMKEVTGYEGRLVFDTSKPDGTPRKVLDVSNIFELGWRPRTNLRDGLRLAYDWALKVRAFDPEYRSGSVSRPTAAQPA